MLFRYGSPAARASRLGLCGLGLLVTGCGVLNPALTGTVNGGSIPGVDAPDGYILIMLMNQSTSSIVANVDIVKQNGGRKKWTLTTGALGFYALAQDCDVVTIQFVDFGFSSVGGTNVVPSNLGPLTIGQSVNCGNVVSVTATGNPPVFSVRVN